MALLEVQDLRVCFYTEYGTVRAVDSVSLSVERETTVGVVGESGCGKTVMALSIMGLIPSPPGVLESGRILYQPNGHPIDLARLDPKGRRMRAIRGNDIGMIFQEPMTSLNPVFTVGRQIAEAIVLHQGLSRKDARARAVDMLHAVGIPSPEQRIDAYPHQLSGGMRQRAMIAMALSCNPALLIADEPTTALDVTIQAQVLELMNQLRAKGRTSILFITHDLGVIAQMADLVAVMYLGRIVEIAPVAELFDNPRHPYTLGLLHSIPSLTMSRGQRLVPIRGSLPMLWEVPPACGFEPRCPRAKDICRAESPCLREVAAANRPAQPPAHPAAPGSSASGRPVGHRAACWFA